jgi:Fic family protein
MDKNVDKNWIIEIPTFKSGLLPSVCRYDRSKFLENLIKARVLYTTIADIPILPSLSSPLEEELIRRSIFGTAAIEGNPLPEAKVNKILSEIQIRGKIERAEKEIRNLKQAYDLLRNIGSEASSKPFVLSEDFIKEAHKIITIDIPESDNVPGEYRKHHVVVGDEQHGGIYTPPVLSKEIQTVMREFTEWINEGPVLQEDPAIRAALAHYYLALIHPFGDGNGRTARFIEAVLLKSAGIKYVPHMMSNFYYKNVDEYFGVFSLSERNENGEVTPFLNFFFQGLVTSLEEIKGRITFLIRKFSLRDYYQYLKKMNKIRQRQYDLLNTLLDHPQPFSHQDLFNLQPFQIIYRRVSQKTASRDLKKLVAAGLIVLQEGKYSLNIGVLG